MMRCCYFKPSYTVVFLIGISSSTALALASQSPPFSSSSLSGLSPIHPQNKKSQDSVHLQRIHNDRPPAETMKLLAEKCLQLGIDAFDIYGDFDKDAESSFLRRFEAEIAAELGMEDAVFMPSGGMAQSIALLIHRGATTTKASRFTEHTATKKSYFACHHTSHLLLHEQDGYRELLQMEPVIISTTERARGISIPPMEFQDVQRALDQHQENGNFVSTLILEIPHREIGGKLTPWKDVLKMKEYCHENNIKFHLDGARIFEATTGYNHSMSLKELTLPFDSVYISFYKGLGGLCGSMLLGSTAFCQEARIWLRRFGGNLFTLMPYVASGWAGFRRQWKLETDDINTDQRRHNILSFQEKKEKLVVLVQTLSSDPYISQVLSFDPRVPEINMVHGYLKASVEACTAALDKVENEHGLRVLVRVRPVSSETPAYLLGYRAYFEWTIGESNGNIPNEKFLLGWREVAKHLLLSE